MKEFHPPRLGEWLLQKINQNGDIQETLGDFHELYRNRLSRNGRFRAVIWYFLQLIRLYRSQRQLSFYWSCAMLKNYIVISFRSIRRQKGYSIINISGLALGLTAFLLISAWVLNELNYDRFHDRAKSIYQVIEKRIFPDEARFSRLTPGQLAPELKLNYPEIQESARTAWAGTRIIEGANVKSYEDSIMTADPSFFQIFSFPFIAGRPEDALSQPGSIVISKNIAEKYFGKENPLGKILILEGRTSFSVTGVMENIPQNSSLQFEMVVPFEVVENLGWDTRSWDFSMASTFLLLKNKSEADQFGIRIKDFIKKQNSDSNIELFLQPLTKIHLYSDLSSLDTQEGVIYLYMFMSIGFMILIMACINFMNLATARSEKRAREIGLRKVVGAVRKQLVRQFLIEAMVIVFISLLLTPLLFRMLLPFVNRIAGVTFSFSMWANPLMLGLVLGTALITGLAAGSYPAFFLSSFQPTRVLKPQNPSSRTRNSLRKTLVFLQMSISLVLILASLLVFKQIQFLKNKDLGFDKHHVVSLPLGIGNSENRQIFERFRNEIEGHPFVESMAASFTSIDWFGTPAKQIEFESRRLDDDTPVYITSVDSNFIETMKIKVQKGRAFSDFFGSEKGNLLVNESFEKLMNTDSALNKTIKIGDNYKGEIIGVIKDFFIESMTESLIAPLIIFHNPAVNIIYVRTRPGGAPAVMADLERAWEKAAPHLPFSYEFLDAVFNRQFQDIENIGRILKTFTLMAGFIACLGLFGLASFSTEKRRKEIGIRKILGSSTAGVISLFWREYVKLIILANICAAPIAWLIMQNWLERFPYRTEINWYIFFIAAVITLGITLSTVGFQIIKASLKNPADILKYE